MRGQTDLSDPRSSDLGIAHTCRALLVLRHPFTIKKSEKKEETEKENRGKKIKKSEKKEGKKKTILIFCAGPATSAQPHSSKNYASGV